MKVAELRPISKEVNISWDITKFGDAMLKIEQGDQYITMSPLQSIKVLSAISEMAHEAMCHNLENNCMDWGGKK